MPPRHDLPPFRAPTREEAAASRLFSPAPLGPRVARTRSWVPAMVPWRATESGEVTAALLDWYGRFADGRPGVLVVEATGIRDVPSGPLLRIGDDRFIRGLARLVETVRQRSAGETLLLIQLIDFLTIRRRPEPIRFFQRYLELRPAHAEALKRLRPDEPPPADEEALRAALARLSPQQWPEVLSPRELRDLEYGYREEVGDTHLPHIAELPHVLPGLFAEAAERAREAGFDGVELHYAHAYTMASFLSRRNERADGYGGDREGRVRLPREVLQEVLRRVGGDLIVGCRLLGDEVIEGGSRLADAIWYSIELARAGLDFVSVSKGGKFEDARQPRIGEAAYPYTGPSGLECIPTVRIQGAPPFGRNLPLAAGIRRALRARGLEIPVVAAGGICTFDQAEQALERGDCDFVAAARQSLADPDWWRKLALGRGDEVRRCTYTNYCEGLDQRHREVTCKLWDRDFGRPDPGRAAICRSSDRKRRLVPPPWEPDPGEGDSP